MGVTNVRSRYVCVAAGAIMILLGLSPKLAAVVEAVPQFVLGGAGLVMFGMVAAAGVRILGGGRRLFRAAGNLMIVAISVGVGMIPLVADKFFQFLPTVLGPLLQSGIVLAMISAVLLNLYYNGRGAARTAPAPT